MKILSVDLESNGLHGPVFAIGAVLVDEEGRVLDQFRGRCPVEGEPRPFVRREVLPALEGYQETHGEYASMRASFWTWFQEAREDALVCVDCGWPKEARFFIALAEDDLDDRCLKGPYPLHEIATLLLAAGVDPDCSREAYAADLIPAEIGAKHDPHWDAFCSALCAIKALRAVGRL